MGIMQRLSAYTTLSCHNAMIFANPNGKEMVCVRKLLLLFLCCLSTLCGCSASQHTARTRVITGITVTATQDARLISRHFTDAPSMERIMQYLRSLDPYNQTDIAPDSFRTDAYEIIVSYSDGNHSVYHQIYDQYFQANDGSWRRIDPKSGGKLPGLLGSMLQT